MATRAKRPFRDARRPAIQSAARSMKGETMNTLGFRRWKRAFVIGIAVFSIAKAAAAAQHTAPQAAPQAAASAEGDFTEGKLKFHHLVGGFIQVIDIEKNQAAGTVILPRGGAPVFAPMLGYDIKSAYEKHMNGSAQQPAADAANALPSTPAKATAAGWDAANNEATLPSGTAVTFTDKKHIHVVQANGREYWIEHLGKSAWGFAKTWASNQGGGRGAPQGTGGFGGIGSSLLGEGIRITTKIDFGDGNPRIVEAFNTRTGSNRTVAAMQAQFASLVDDLKQAVATVPTDRTDITKSPVVTGVTHMNAMEGYKPN